MDVALAAQDILDAGRGLVARHPDIGAIVLECTNMPPYAHAAARGARAAGVRHLLADHLAARGPAPARLRAARWLMTNEEETMAEETNRYDVTAARAARQAGTRDAARQHHDRHSRARLQPRGRRLRRAASRRQQDPAWALRHAGDGGAEPQAGERARAHLDRYGDAARRHGQDGHRHPGRHPGAAADLHDAGTGVAMQATRIVNDGMAEFAARKPDRFVPMGAVPLQAGAEALENSNAAWARCASRAWRCSPTSPGVSCRSPSSRRSGRAPSSLARW